MQIQKRELAVLVENIVSRLLAEKAEVSTKSEPKPKKARKAVKHSPETLAKLAAARDAWFKKQGFGPYAKKNKKKAAA